MKKRNARVRQSIELITDALLRLMEEKELQDITVSEICREATVSRNTFYRSFSGKEEVLEDLIEEKIDHVLSEYLMLKDFDITKASEADIRSAYERSYSFWDGERKLLEILRRQGLLWLLDKAYVKIIEAKSNSLYEDISGSQDPDYFMDYLYFWQGDGTSKILEKWALRGFTESVEELTEVTIRLHQLTNYRWD